MIVGGPTYRLGGVVNKNIEGRGFREQPIGECHDIWQGTQAEVLDPQPALPGVEVWLTGVAKGGLPREPGRDHDLGPVAEEFQRRLVADLDPPARDGRPPTRQ